MKKGQITLFIILGIVLIIGVSFYLYVNQRTVQGLAPSVLEAPVQIRPVVQFVSDCLQKSGEDAIVRIGAGGGFIDVRTQGAKVNPIEPTESDAIEFGTSSELAVPYWWYLESPNDCVGACRFSTFRPPLRREDERSGVPQSIETQLDAEVARTVDTCVGNFTLLTGQGFAVVASSQPKVTTTIGATGVSYLLDYPISITRDGQEFHSAQYGSHIEVPLTEMYEVATELTRIESDPKYNFLERHVQQVIDSFTGLHDGGLPPVAYATFDMDSGKRWVKEDVRREVRSLITNYMPLLQVWGTSNYIFREAPATTQNTDLWSRLYNLNMLIPLAENHPNLEVRFSAPDWWREFFNLNCRGQICGPDSMVNTYGFPFGFQKYNFAYSVSVPVLIELRDPQAFGGNGFVFQYAMEANVRDNEPMPFIFNPLTSNDTPAASLLCDPLQRTGSTITVKVIDGVTGAPVDAAVSLACGDEGCAMGQTQGGQLTTPFPRCAGAEINAVAVDHYSFPVAVNTHQEDTQTVTITSSKVREFNADFSRVQFVKQKKQWRFDETVQPKRVGDQVVIMLNRQISPEESPFSSAVEICGAPVDNSLATVRLVPGNYTVNIIALYHEPIIFPAQKRCVQDFCYTIPEEPLVFGQTNAGCTADRPVPIGNSEFNWEVTPQMLSSGNTVMFKSLVAAIDQTPEDERDIEDLSIVGDLQTSSIAYQQYLQPEVIRR